MDFIGSIKADEFIPAYKNYPTWNFIYRPIKTVKIRNDLIRMDLEAHLKRDLTNEEIDPLYDCYIMSKEINSDLSREKSQSNLVKYYSFYCLNNRRYELKSIDARLSQVRIPDGAKGKFQDYLTYKEWEYKPELLLDELVCITNSCYLKSNLQLNNDYGLRMMELCTYVICLTDLDKFSYKDKQFIRWSLLRAKQAYYNNYNYCGMDSSVGYWEPLKKTEWLYKVCERNFSTGFAREFLLSNNTYTLEDNQIEGYNLHLQSNLIQVY